MENMRQRYGGLLAPQQTDESRHF